MNEESIPFLGRKVIFLLKFVNEQWLAIEKYADPDPKEGSQIRKAYVFCRAYYSIYLVYLFC